MKRLCLLLAIICHGIGIYALPAPGSLSYGDIFNISSNDPLKAPALYAGIMYMNNAGFSSSTRTNTGIGADVKYWHNKWRWHAAYSQGVFDRITSASNTSYCDISGDAIQYVRAAGLNEEVNLQVRNKDGEAQTLTVQAMVNSRLGVKVGSNYTITPLNAVVRSNTNDFRLTSASSLIVSAGFAWTRTYNVEISAAGTGGRRVCPVRTWYAELLYASYNDAGLHNTDPLIKAENYPVIKTTKAGVRAGYEWTSSNRWRNLGAMYNIECGYRPGLRGYSDGLYIKFNAGICLDR